jgi:hypothetical protein
MSEGNDMTERGGPVARRELLTVRALARVVDDLERGDPAPEGATVGADDPVPDG